MSQSITAKLRYLRISPRKVRLVADLIRGMPVRRAEAELMLLPKRASIALLKVLRSAIANAENNFHLQPGKLYIKELKVDKGPVIKRWTPRARGSASQIQKKSSHISLILNVSEKITQPDFVFLKKPKKKEEKTKSKPSAKQKIKPALPATESKTPAKREGIKKWFFRRKAV